MKINAMEIKNFRKKYRFTQSGLAELLGVSYRTIQNYEKGVPIPKSKAQLFQKVFEEYKGNSSKFEAQSGEESWDIIDVKFQDISLDDVVKYVVLHDEELMKNKLFQAYIKNKQAEKAIEILLGEIDKMRDAKPDKNAT